MRSTHTLGATFAAMLAIAAGISSAAGAINHGGMSPAGQGSGGHRMMLKHRHLAGSTTSPQQHQAALEAVIDDVAIQADLAKRHGSRRSTAAPAVAAVAVAAERQQDLSLSSSSPAAVTLGKKRHLKKRKTCKPKKKPGSGSSSSSSSSSGNGSGSSSSGSSSSSNSGTGSSSGSSSSSSDTTWDVGSEYLRSGNIMVGFLPDDGSGGGKVDSLTSLNKVLPAKSAWYGRYAQVSKGKTFDGSQLYQVLDDVKANGAILQASVMPYGTWEGLTEGDNHNAVAIAKVCNDIYKTHGVEVWLRFAHEMNWYQTDGTYSGGVSDFQTGWKVLSEAIEQYAPETKMFWSPNVGSDSDYEKYYPKQGRVDIVGFDYYPMSASENFVERAKPFHDKYAVNGIKMVQGETGLHYTGSNDERMQWVKSLSSQETQKALPNYLGFAWFNYDKFENGKQIDFKIVKPNEGAGSGINSMLVSFLKSG